MGFDPSGSGAAVVRWPWPWAWRRDADLEEARRAAEEAERRLAAVRRDDPIVRARAERMRQIARENNLAPLILRALGVQK
jgi:hypothetical protein